MLRRDTKDDQVEDALIKGFTRVRDKGARINEQILLRKSEDFAKQLGHDQFKATTGWLYRLMKRSDMKRKKNWGEEAIADLEARDKWLKEEWPKLREKYPPEDIRRDGPFLQECKKKWFNSIHPHSMADLKRHIIQFHNFIQIGATRPQP